jgi:hypothetical protein
MYSARKGVSSGQFLHFQKEILTPEKNKKPFYLSWKAAGTIDLICNKKK